MSVPSDVNIPIDCEGYIDHWWHTYCLIPPGLRQQAGMGTYQSTTVVLSVIIIFGNYFINPTDGVGEVTEMTKISKTFTFPE
jgi:hypothetical protein